jgi:uncharacterized protein YjdB
MEICKRRSTRRMMLGLMIPMLVACWSCSDMPVAHLTTPTPTSTATQQSTLAPVLSAQIAPSIEKMRIGETLKFSIQLEFGEGVPPSGPLSQWSSTNRAVILIDLSGKATAVGEGNATIEVTAHGQKITRNIQVTS